jgi:hypothetical protein
LTWPAQIVRVLRNAIEREGINIAGFTLLRCDDALLDTKGEQHQRFVRFIGFMKDLSSFTEIADSHQHCPRCVRKPISFPATVVKKIGHVDRNVSGNNTYHPLDQVSRRRLSEIVKTMQSNPGAHVHAKVSRVPSRLGLIRQASLAQPRARASVLANKESGS